MTITIPKHIIKKNMRPSFLELGILIIPSFICNEAKDTKEGSSFVSDRFVNELTNKKEHPGWNALFFVVKGMYR